MLHLAVSDGLLETSAAQPGIHCFMVCGKCGHWAYQYDWIQERLGENNPRRWHGYADPDGPAKYWFMVCKPDCQLNAVRHASFQLEEEAAASRAWNCQAVHVVQVGSLVRAEEELRDAWTVYYAYW